MTESSVDTPRPLAPASTGRTDRSQIARQRMLTAASELIAEGGLAYATLARIGERAGYSRGLADYHFGSKTELVEQLVKDVAQRWEDALAPVRRDQVDGLRALLLEVHSYMARSEESPLTARVLGVLSAEAITVTPEIKNPIARHNESFRRRLRKWIVEAQEEGTIHRHIDPTHASVLIQAILRGVILQWTLSPESFRPTEMTDLIVDVAVGGMCRPAGLLGILDTAISQAQQPDVAPAVDDSRDRRDER